MKVEVVTEGKEVRCTFDELIDDELDSKGNFSVWRLSKFFMDARLAWILNSENIKLVFRTECSFFVRSQKITVYPAFYSKIRHSISAVCTARVIQVGKTSLVMVFDLQMKSTGEMISTCLLHYVCVSIKTRRSMPLPLNYIHDHADLTKIPRPTIVSEFPGFPTNPRNLFNYPIVVVSSDIDNNGHTNHSRYIEYCMVCADFAARERVYSIIRKDVTEYQVRDISLTYLGESLLNDKLLVTSWEDNRNPHIVYFVIHKDKRLIFWCSINFNISKLQSRI
ncbi:uncharacterized protein LOC102808960 [Saccoglossus kowalevskii]|uniref:Uncharacterized protein LOC102808960 n=1 Tax=Saccoglossus kowalevskii TaxID=10224 RepID=A0ABM0MAN6_SACKO|nr:PREDICTED: uncharacterized protein LOC102808960 [Saccoglossus kowalevskii]